MQSADNSASGSARYRAEAGRHKIEYDVAALQPVHAAL